jgi:hypothetical protein
MCDTCIPILKKYAKFHPTTPCPLEKALFCSLCCTHGHSPKRCSRKELRAYRAEVTPPEDTPVEVSYPTGYETHYEILDSEPTIRAALLANDIVPMICQKIGKDARRDYHENKKRLIEHMKKHGRTLVLVTL